tara:strand:+ start:425 stop:730 length:306 start_codon:yes stop_codon:yes gene_type:complete
MSIGLAGKSINLPMRSFCKIAALFGGSISLGVLIGASSKLLTKGILPAYVNSLTTGILLFVAIEFYQKDFGHENNHEGGHFSKFFGLSLGAATMSAMSIWT